MAFSEDAHRSIYLIRSEVLSAFEREEDLSELLRILCASYEKHSPTDVRCTILLNDDGRMKHGAAPSFPPPYLEAIDGHEIGDDAGTCGAALFRGETVLSDDIANDPIWDEFRELANEYELGACWSVPVKFDTEVLASFGVYAPRGELPGEFDRTLLEGVTSLTSMVISRFRLQDALVRERVRIEQILEATGLGVWEWSPGEESATMSKRACRLLGYESIEEVRKATGRQLPGLIHPHDLFAFQNAIKPLFDGSKDYYEIDVRYKHADGSWIWILNRGRAVERGPDGQLLRMAGIIQDISSQKAIEGELRSVERLASLGKLAGGIAHDFNNILTGVFGGIEAAIGDLPDDHPARDSLELSKSALSRARGLTSQLLTFSKGGEPNVSEVDLEKILRNVVRFDLSDTRIDHRITSDDDLWVACVDPDQIKQVFSNLVVNARDSMESGTLHIHLENWRGEVGLPPNYVQVTFTDEGEGIEEELLGRVFEPYFSTKARGHGLGLAICHSIVARHKGRIQIESTCGEGTVVTLFLPADPDATLQESSSSEDRVGGRPLRILVMDDEPMILRMARRLLERMGHEVKCVSDGEEAIEAFRKSRDSGDHIDVFILDLTIRGGLAGGPTAERILKLDPEAKLVASSGYADSPILSDFREHGFSGTLPKPYSVEELQKVIVQAVGENHSD